MLFLELCEINYVEEKKYFSINFFLFHTFQAAEAFLVRLFEDAYHSTYVHPQQHVSCVYVLHVCVSIVHCTLGARGFFFVYCCEW